MVNIQKVCTVIARNVFSFVWISEQTGNFAVHNIKGMVFVTEMTCLLRGTHTVLIKQTHFVFKWLA
jgi:hypothetical protein